MSDYTNPTDKSISRGVVPENGVQSALGVTADALVKVGFGRVFAVTVVVAGSGVGGVYDADSVAHAAAGNQIYITPQAVGTVILSWPCGSGIVVKPGSGQTIAVSYA